MAILPYYAQSLKNTGNIKEIKEIENISKELGKEEL